MSFSGCENKKKYHKVVPAPLCAVSLVVAGFLIAISPVLQSRIVAAETQFTDFNGDGYADLAIGVPGSSSSDSSSAPGSVNVIYGSSSGLSASKGRADQIWTQNTPGINDAIDDFQTEGFGWSVTTADFNNDGYTDLAIGAPGETLGSIGAAGAVHVIYGSSQGLKATAVASGNGREDQFFTQNTSNVEDVSEQSDRFGFSLAAGNFNGDNFADLAIGVLGESVSSVGAAGAVNVIYGSSNGLSPTAALPDQLLVQENNRQETPEAGDRWGRTLAVGDFNNDGKDDLAVASTGQDFSGATDTGAVSVIYGAAAGLGNNIPSQTWTQNSLSFDASDANDAFGSSMATGDFNNDSYDDLAIGVPGEADGALFAVGAVSVIYGSSAGLSAPGNQLWYQSSPDIEGDNEDRDFFGSALAAGDFNNDGFSDLAIGIPSEAFCIGDFVTEDGAVSVIYGSSGGLSATAALADQIHSQSGTLKGLSCEILSSDQLGSALAVGDFNNDERDDLAVGVPGEGLFDFDDESVDAAGSVNVIYGSSSGLQVSAGPGTQVWNRHTPSVEGNIAVEDAFGFALATG